MTAFLRSTLACVLLVAPLAGVSAQDAASSETIVVEAPRSVPLPNKRSATTGAKLVITTVKIPVRYDDLDLTKPEDGDRLMARVENVAQDACEELDRFYPLIPDADCRVHAVASGKAAAKAAIAAAKPKP